MPSIEEQLAQLQQANAQLLAAVNAQTAEVGAKMGAIDGRVSAAEQQVDDYVANAASNQGHLRLTRNQRLVANAGGTFWDGWSSGSLVSARVLETVVPGVPPADRSARAREFLQAVNSDVSHVSGTFEIWEIEIAAPAGTTRYLPYQQIQPAGTHTAGAIVKHISGPVPTGWWCNELAAGEAAKLCLSHANYGEISARNVYTFTHPALAGNDTQNCFLEVALPAVVNGYVPPGSGWGLFPKIPDNAYE